MSPPSKSSRRKDESVLKIQIDGAARGNPGPAGIGAVFMDARGRPCGELSLALGEATNNVAESCALILSLQEALHRGAKRVVVETDSELLARQVTGAYRVKDRQLQWIHVLIQNLLPSFSHFEIRHIPREENRKADRLAGRAANQSLKQTAASAQRPKAIPKVDPTQLSLF